MVARGGARRDTWIRGRPCHHELYIQRVVFFWVFMGGWLGVFSFSRAEIPVGLFGFSQSGIFDWLDVWLVGLWKDLLRVG